ncbi:MAG: aminodeoxychorismate/anthranilate synthase component II [Candidatus Magasanikbacteria bacterium]|nr:aminodeoxychorismate/anthranilate synthase component II [Candidatus Magasanikbacteria bacterium]
MKILIIDNYDSFTYNLYQLVGEILMKKNSAYQIDVKRNDEITISQIQDAHYDRIIISPGPGDPRDEAYFGVCRDVILEIGKTVPVFGVCLGMQGMAHYFGAKIMHLSVPVHGKVSQLEHKNIGVFAGLPQGIEVMRYHSLMVDPTTIPDELEVTAQVVGSGEIMGLKHKKYPIEGVQFHPESFATEGGRKMVENFLKIFNSPNFHSAWFR